MDQSSTPKKQKISPRHLAISAAMVLAAAGFWIAKSVRKNDEPEKHRKPAAAAGKKKKARKISPVPGSEELCAQLRTLGGGKPMRVVWVEDRTQEHSDSFANSNELRLVGFDSENGGYAPILPGPKNFSRPLLTPDGEQVIYTDKRGAGGKFNPQIRIVDFDGENDRELGTGFCVDVTKDPQTGATVVYALESLNADRWASIDGERLFRFRINDPEKREPLWDKSALAVDNLQVSRDGKRFGTLFPWPEGGIADPASGIWKKLGRGCWASLAPDNSYLFWMFSGTHKKIRLFDTHANREWNVQLSDAPGVNNHQVYHPRWSNHPLFFTMTGPYPTKIKGRPAATGNVIAQSGQSADVFVGRFSPKMDRVDAWVRLTSNTWGDFYPDVWIEDGDEVNLSEFAQAKPQETITVESDGWPAATAGLQFVWRNAGAKNEIAGRHLACRIVARGTGRFGRRGELLLDGGWFETDEITKAELGKAVAAANAVSIEAVVTPSGSDGAQRLAALTNSAGTVVFELWRNGGNLAFRSPAGGLAAAALSHTASAPPDRPLHFRFSLDRGTARWTIDGAPQPPADLPEVSLAACAGGSLLLGDTTAPPDAQLLLQDIAVYARTLSESEAAANFAGASRNSLPPAPRLRFKGRLVEATVPDKAKLASYRRMLVDHVYEVTEVLEGKTDLKRIVVLHWGVLDTELVPGIPRELEREYELVVEPTSSHPELDSELTDQESLETETFLDIQPPARPPQQ